jgi:hypothetical protein
MLAKNAPSSKMAECFLTIGGERYNFMSAINVEVNFEKSKTEIPILGRMNRGNKATGSKITGSGTFHKNTSIWNKIAYKFQETGEDLYFEMQITNEDPTTEIGRQTIMLYGCNFDTITLAAFDADSDDVLTESIDFTAERFEMPSEYKMMDGMI